MGFYEVVRKLIGQIEPVGDSGIDERRLANFQEQCKLTLDLMQDIVYIARGYRSSQEYSVQRINKIACEMLDEFREVMKDD